MGNKKTTKTTQDSQSAVVVVRCADCRYWDDTGDEEEYSDDETLGKCKRYPPTQQHYDQPETYNDDYCGEARKRI